jgi:hypothetical protein
MEDVIYENTVDSGAFTVRVVASADSNYRAHLKVWVTDGELLLDEEVPLSYGAIFGPDVSDVAEWQERALVVIDRYLADHDGK